MKLPRLVARRRRVHSLRQRRGPRGGAAVVAQLELGNDAVGRHLGNLPDTGHLPSTGSLPGTGDFPNTGDLPGTGSLPWRGDDP